jgi:hypothetical protein
MLYKSCRVFHKESKKLGLCFLDFFTIFYGFYKIQSNTYTISETNLQGSPYMF